MCLPNLCPAALRTPYSYLVSEQALLNPSVLKQYCIKHKIKNPKQAAAAVTNKKAIEIHLV